MSACTTISASFSTSDTTRGNCDEGALRRDSSRQAGRLPPPAADVLVSEIAADEAFLGLRAGNAPHASERRQIQETLVLRRRVLPHEKPGAFDVGGVGEPEQQPIAVGGCIGN